MRSNPMIGHRIGKYEITGEIGRGGMGIVYEATQVSLNRQVAVKMLPYHLANSEEFLSRFLREAETLARLNHANIVHIYDVEEEDENRFIIMEYVGGPPLSRLLRMHGRLSPEMARDIAAAIASGLAAAHRKGIVHRDIKPDNILFTNAGQPKLTDFGIAHTEDTRFKTQTGTTMGTPYYISPEQAQGRQVTEQSDLYSLGVVLYEMLAGRRPFEAENSLMIFMKHVQEAPPPILEHVPDLNPELAAFVHRALSKEPLERMLSAEDFAATLNALDLGAAPGMALRIDFPELAEAEVYRTMIDRGDANETRTPGSDRFAPIDVDETRDPDAEALQPDEYPTRRLTDEERLLTPSGGTPSASASGGSSTPSQPVGTSATGATGAGDSKGKKSQTDRPRRTPPLSGVSPGGAASVDAVPELSQSWIRRTASALLPQKSRAPWPIVAAALVGAVVIFFGARGLMSRLQDDGAPVTEAQQEPATDAAVDPAEASQPGTLTDALQEREPPPPEPTPEEQSKAIVDQVLAQPDDPAWSAGRGRAEIGILVNRFRRALSDGDIDELVKDATPLGAAHLRATYEHRLASTRDRETRFEIKDIEFEGQRMARAVTLSDFRALDAQTNQPVVIDETVHWTLIRDGSTWRVHQIKAVAR